MRGGYRGEGVIFKYVRLKLKKWVVLTMLMSCMQVQVVECLMLIQCIVFAVRSLLPTSISCPSDVIYDEWNQMKPSLFFCFHALVLLNANRRTKNRESLGPRLRDGIKDLKWALHIEMRWMWQVGLGSCDITCACLWGYSLHEVVIVCEEGRVVVEELGVMSSGPSVHTSSRVPKARRHRSVGKTFWLGGHSMYL